MDTPVYESASLLSSSSMSSSKMYSSLSCFLNNFILLPAIKVFSATPFNSQRAYVPLLLTFDTVWSKPPLSELFACIILRVKRTIINEHPVSYFNWLRTQSMSFIKIMLVLHSRFS
ncbi:hypothetical protein KP509_04G065300 [Ceratopteris richardii]|uniref:Uncharacterized protein n=1 Tax=Ceratopteris richardii TaxID=49495 RepID=A0A8T2V5H2_CERRI|nr:hypothetical protein KP509_04G065300 [Ceratopteris richardii]